MTDPSRADYFSLNRCMEDLLSILVSFFYFFFYDLLIVMLIPTLDCRQELSLVL